MSNSPSRPAPQPAASRRSFLQQAPLLATGALAACGQTQQPQAPAVQTQQHFKWKMVTTWPKNFPALGTGANNLAQSIEAMSGGRLQVKVYGAGELVPASGVFDAVSGGTAEMGHGAAYYWKGKHEATQFFSAVPFGLNATEINGWLRYGGGQELWDELYAQFNLKAFPVGNTGVQMGGWFNKEINELDDFSGLVMRMPGLGGEVLRGIGATVKSLPGGEIFQALKTGAIDATEWVGPYNDLAFGLHQAAKYYYWPGWHEPGTALECMINSKALSALPTDLQATVAYACQAANGDMLNEFTARNNSALVTLVEKHDVQLRRFPDELLAQVGKVAAAVVAEIASKDPFSNKVYASFDAFRRESVSYTRITEEAYTQARALTFS
ncbi:MAG: TRAP transporter substrate-binding protein [Candidatus Latescibacterota bacterium]|nr:TRAP transporter substrate-binding protein [Candidatus Latescibacterota bacterium]